MSPSVRRILKKGLGVVALACLAVLGILYVQALAKIDPFARLRHPNTGLEDRVGIRLENVSVRHYHGAKLVTLAKVDRLDVTKDRSQFNLYGIHDGVYRGEKNAVQFSGDRGVWNDTQRVLRVTSGAHVTSKDFDLKVAECSYSNPKASFTVPGDIQGKLVGGKVKAANFIYNLHDRSLSAGPIEWTGPLALHLQDGDQPKQWKINGAHFSSKGEIQSWKDGTADSGDTIIKAPLIQRNTTTDVITATGRVRYFSEKANMICDQAVIYNKEKRAILTGSVDMLIKPKDNTEKVAVVDLPAFKPQTPDEVKADRPQAATTEDQKKQEDDLRSGKTVRKYPMMVTAARIEYWYRKGERRAEITGSPQARQELPAGLWRHIWTHHAHYDGQQDLLRLYSSEGNRETRMKNSVGDDLTAKWLLVSTKDDDDSMEAEDPQGTVFGSDEDENGSKTTSTKPTTTKPPTKPPTKGGTGLKGQIGKRSRSGK